MPTKRIYRRIAVKEIELNTLRELAIQSGGRGTCVGLDIAKGEKKPRKGRTRAKRQFRRRGISNCHLNLPSQLAIP